MKDPAYPDTRYVVELVTAGVVNTMPEAHPARGGRPRRAPRRHGPRPTTTRRSRGAWPRSPTSASTTTTSMHKLEDDGLSRRSRRPGPRSPTALDGKLARRDRAAEPRTIAHERPDARSPSSAPAWPAPRPPRRCAPKASTDTSSCSAPSRTGPTSGHRCPRTTCRAAPTATRSSCTRRVVRRPPGRPAPRHHGHRVDRRAHELDHRRPATGCATTSCC